MYLHRQHNLVFRSSSFPEVLKINCDAFFASIHSADNNPRSDLPCSIAVILSSLRLTSHGNFRKRLRAGLGRPSPRLLADNGSSIFFVIDQLFEGWRRTDRPGADSPSPSHTHLSLEASVVAFHRLGPRSLCHQFRSVTTTVDSGRPHRSPRVSGLPRPLTRDSARVHSESRCFERRHVQRVVAGERPHVACNVLKRRHDAICAVNSAVVCVLDSCPGSW